MRTGFFEVAASATGDPPVCISIYAPVAPHPGVPVLRSRLESAKAPTLVNPYLMRMIIIRVKVGGRAGAPIRHGSDVLVNQ